jgi:hypothetical protein
MVAFSQAIRAQPKKAGPQNRITLSCGPRRTTSCRYSLSGAVREVNLAEGFVDSISFCSGFWTAAYSNDVIKGRPQSVKDLGNRNVIAWTYEQILLHEIGHCQYRMASGKYAIEDPRTVYLGNSLTVYGAKLTSVYWAWACAYPKADGLHCHGYPTPSINPYTCRTAETYAWMYQNRFFAQAWNWQDDGSPGSWDASNAIDPDPQLYSGDDATDDFTAGVENGAPPGDFDAVPDWCTPAGTDSHGAPLWNCVFPPDGYDQ